MHLVGRRSSLLHCDQDRNLRRRPEVESMKRTKRSVAITWLVACSLVLSLFGGILLDDRANASNGESRRGDNGFRADKIEKVSSSLRQTVRAAMSRNGQDDLKVILRLNGNVSGQLRSLLSSNGIKVKKEIASFNTLVLELPPSVVYALSTFSEVELITTDDEVRSLAGHS